MVYLLSKFPHLILVFILWVTFHSYLCNASPTIRHLTEVNSVIINTNVTDSQSPFCPQLLHSIFGPWLQPPVFQIPCDGNRVFWNFTLKNSQIPFPYLKINERLLEPHRWFCWVGRTSNTHGRNLSFKFSVMYKFTDVQVVHHQCLSQNTLVTRCECLQQTC